MRMEKLLQTYWIELLFIGLLVVAIITGNKTVGISAAIVLALRLLRVTPALELLSAKGINWGIIVLTVGFLAPLALGKYSLEQVMVVLKSPAGWIAIACGALVAYGRGRQQRRHCGDSGRGAGHLHRRGRAEGQPGRPPDRLRNGRCGHLAGPYALSFLSGRALRRRSVLAALFERYETI